MKKIRLLNRQKIKKKIDSPVARDAKQESGSVEKLSQNDLEGFMQLADLGVSGFTLPQQTTNAPQNKETTSVDWVEEDFPSEQIGETKSLPDGPALVLVANTAAMPSAIESALHTDIDSNIAAITVDKAENPLTVAEQAKIITEDIADEINNITPQLRHESNHKFDNLTPELKVNPAVAMDMGKGDKKGTLATISLNNAKKSGFSKIAAKAKEPLPQRTAKETINNILSVDNAHVTLPNKSQEVSQDILDNTASEIKYVFFQQNKDVPFEGNVGKNMHSGKESADTRSIVPPKYVFNAEKNIELAFYGEVSKNLAKGKTNNEDAPVILRQYVFAANNQETAFSGDVGKRLLLGVK